MCSLSRTTILPHIWHKTSFEIIWFSITGTGFQEEWVEQKIGRSKYPVLAILDAEALWTARATVVKLPILAREEKAIV
ncbi:hypothetical protein CEXT_38631 [Caerostris extrusa]|uniref:Uncharacterized protein n=1 Tax=Caerostris extrusa TaxID=172846 RepID=A0AAV4UXI3_CAEEX|nr:hypothetical protein CEXT_38631 [Caerostris extrusa]